MINRDTDIDDPEKMKEHIASKQTTNTYKEGLARAHDHYVLSLKSEIFEVFYFFKFVYFLLELG